MITNPDSLILNSLDDVLCAGNSKMSKRIQWSNRLLGVKGPAAKISHVAKIYREDGHLFVFESTTMNKWANQRGVQLNPFEEWYDNYDGEIWVRLFDMHRRAEEHQTACKLFTEFIGQYLGTDYESGIPGFIELFLTSLDLPFINFKTPEIHCSEGSVMANQSAGIQCTAPLPNKMPPYMFWNGGQYEQSLYWKLLPAIQIK